MAWWNSDVVGSIQLLYVRVLVFIIFASSYKKCGWNNIIVQSMSITSAPTAHHFVGFDLGTSGARMSIIVDDHEKKKDDSSSTGTKEVFSSSIVWKEYDDEKAWLDATYTLLGRAPKEMLENVKSICVSGTSSSCLLVDGRNGKMSRPRPRMYNYDVTCTEWGMMAMSLSLDPYAPPKHTTRANTSSLAKLLSWHQESKIQPYERLTHQSDYISMHLMMPSSSNNDEFKKKCGSGVEPKMIEITSDWHNCLKLGYDVQNQCWPEWLITCLSDLGIQPCSILPSKVISPGQPMGTISLDISKRFGIPEDCVLVGGTTDSNAAFFAAAGSQPAPGTAVTSLGSTLAMKQLSHTFVEDAERGVYSHRFPLFHNNDKDNDSDNEAWLIGGASNVGCAVLRQEEFSDDELITLSKDIDYKERSPLNYYPLVAVAKGERFPVADSNKQPILEPKPESRKEYLHGILQGIAQVEQLGFQTLGELGASPSIPTKVLTCGGGSKNHMWIQLRQHLFRQHFHPEKTDTQDDNNQLLRVEKATNTEASYGAAILAAATFINQ